MYPTIPTMLTANEIAAVISDGLARDFLPRSRKSNDSPIADRQTAVIGDIRIGNGLLGSIGPIAKRMLSMPRLIPVKNWLRVTNPIAATAPARILPMMYNGPI